MPDIPPKLFVSYSWSSQGHEEWVLRLASELRLKGVDVILDKWDLREGQDSNQFMEQMVTDPDIRKVILVCDSQYVQKADQRAGGVGAEAQIISPKLYQRADQSKFVAVLAERDERGQPRVPAYYGSRIFIDLSDEALYAANFEQLLRWVYDKPLHVKPALGEAPLLDSAPSAAPLETTISFQRALAAIKKGRPDRVRAVREYLDALASEVERLQRDHAAAAVDDAVIEAIERFLPYRGEAIQIFVSLALDGLLPDERQILQRFFERLLPLIVGRNLDDAAADHHRFLVHELFLYAMASLLKYERFSDAAFLLRQPYYVQDPPGRRSFTRTFAALRQYMPSLPARNQRLSLRRLSLRADLLDSRTTGSGFSMMDLMQADFIVFLRAGLEFVTSSGDCWYPETLLYAERHDGAFEIFARARSEAYFDSIRCLFEVEDKQGFEIVWQAMRDDKFPIPRWDIFTSFDPMRLMAWEEIGTRP